MQDSTIQLALTRIALPMAQVKHISTSMCPGAVQVHFRRGGDAKGR